MLDRRYMRVDSRRLKWSTAVTRKDRQEIVTARAEILLQESMAWRGCTEWSVLRSVKATWVSQSIGVIVSKATFDLAVWMIGIYFAFTFAFTFVFASSRPNGKTRRGRHAAVIDNQEASVTTAEARISAFQQRRLYTDW